MCERELQSMSGWRSFRGCRSLSPLERTQSASEHHATTILARSLRGMLPSAAPRATQQAGERYVRACTGPPRGRPPKTYATRARKAAKILLERSGARDSSGYRPVRRASGGSPGRVASPPGTTQDRRVNSLPIARGFWRPGRHQLRSAHQFSPRHALRMKNPRKARTNHRPETNQQK